MLGCWLLIAPFVFGHPPEAIGRWATDLACGTVVIAAAWLSFWPPLGRIHLLDLAVAGWLIGFGRLASDLPAAPGHQNEILVGLVLLIVAIVPNRADQPPAAWRRHYRQQAARRPQG